MKTFKTSELWKVNKKGIFKNWRKHEFIRAKYNYRLSAYASFWDNRYSTYPNTENDLPLGTIAKEIYSKA